MLKYDYGYGGCVGELWEWFWYKLFRCFVFYASFKLLDILLFDFVVLS